LGFSHLGRSKCGPFAVRKNNDRVLRLHQALGFVELVNETKDEYFFEVTSKRLFEVIDSFWRRGFGVVSSVK
jgi:hypothetical protein